MKHLRDEIHVFGPFLESQASDIIIFFLIVNDFSSDVRIKAYFAGEEPENDFLNCFYRF
jgi:hypothetical protein